MLAGIDGEDGRPIGHGPIGNYVAARAEHPRQHTELGHWGILTVFGGSTDDYCTGSFWNQIGASLGQTITFSKGPANIAAQSVNGFEMIAVVGSYPETCGGLTQEENDGVAGRSDEIAAFVNRGGGLLGFTQSDFTEKNPFAFLESIGSFTQGDYFTANINPTPAGEAVGITDALDVCCWHTSILTYPEYFEVLATYDNGEAAAIGGHNVTLCKESGLASARRHTPRGCGIGHDSRARRARCHGVEPGRESGACGRHTDPDRRVRWR